MRGEYVVGTSAGHVECPTEVRFPIAGPAVDFCDCGLPGRIGQGAVEVADEPPDPGGGLDDH
jgi:hypothetical protein